MIIEHIAMYVNDLEVARDFFVKYLGGRSNDGYHNRTTGFRSFFISFDGGARSEIMTKPELHKTFATLSQEEQKYANIFLHDIQSGDIIVIAGKTFKEYVIEYCSQAKDDQIHRLASVIQILKAV